MNRSDLFCRPLDRVILDVMDQEPGMTMLGRVHVPVDTSAEQLLGDVDVRPVRAELEAVLDG